jgi:hypothetical protein
MRTVINFIIDFILLILTAALMWTGLVMRFVLPPGYRGCYGWTLWGLSRHDYGFIHFVLSILMVVLCGVHLGLHWKWFCSLISKLTRYKGESLVAVTLVLLLFTISVGSIFFLDRYVYKVKPHINNQKTETLQKTK